MTASQRPWLSLVGIGDDGLAGLNAVTRSIVQEADVVVGGARHLDMLGNNGSERLRWPSPFDTLIAELSARRHQKVCVRATGDPMWFGVGNSLARSFSAHEMAVYPAPSCVSLACAKLAWPIQTTEVVSLHGRSSARLRRYLQPGSRVLVISRDGSTPQLVCEMLNAVGFEDSPVMVMEHLGGEQERVSSCTAREFQLTDVSALNVMAIDCVAGTDARWWSQAPGLPDDAFEHDGMLTKRAVRAVTLAALRPAPAQQLWDVGAGCGSIAIEWLRAAAHTQAIAIERDPHRCAMVRRNADKLGVPELEVHEASAPGGLMSLTAPDAVFIGGGLSEGVFEHCWAVLAPGGRLVANTVTLEGQSLLYLLHEQHGGEISTLAVTTGKDLGRFRAMQPSRTVTQLELHKT
jgi:precorrin-6Y C5,15-methyltransferase (decarboxylating)